MHMLRRWRSTSMKWVRSSIKGGCWHRWMTNHEMQRKMNRIFRLRRKAGYFGSIGRAGSDCSILCARAFLFRWAFYKEIGLRSYWVIKMKPGLFTRICGRMLDVLLGWTSGEDGPSFVWSSPVLWMSETGSGNSTSKAMKARERWENEASIRTNIDGSEVITFDWGRNSLEHTSI